MPDVLAELAEKQLTCQHEIVQQYSTIYALTDWARTPAGTYLPEDAPCTKVLEEDTDRWRCRDCGIQMDEEDAPGGGVLLVPLT